MATQIQLNEPEWNDDFDNSYSEYDNGDYSNDEGEFIGGLLSTGLNAVGSLLKGNPIGAAKSVGSAIGSVLGVQTAPASTAGIQSRSNLAGQVQTAGGRQVPIKLPETVATKQDVNILQTAIQKINGEIKKVAETTTNNGVALTKLSKEVKTVDEKHVSVSKKQNDLIANLGKSLQKLKSDQQMNMMLSMFMQPKLESVTFGQKDGKDQTFGSQPLTVSDSKSTDNTMLMLLMGMMGGDSGSGGFGDMGNNPLMMILMLKAFSGDKGSLF